MFNAGQVRMQGESRGRLREMFVTGRDAYFAGNIATGKVTPNATYKSPAYLSDEPPKGGLTGQDLWDAIDRFTAALGAGVS